MKKVQIGFLGVCLALSLLPISVQASESAVVAPLTVDSLLKLQVSSNEPSGDRFIGTPATLNPIIDALMKDNSMVDSIYLYIAANTALRLNRLSDAAFLFYAAQIRKSFDIKRYALAPANGNNVRTYLDFLNNTVGTQLNPLIMREPAKFSAVIERIKQWPVVAPENALYKKAYGTPQLAENQWASTADNIKGYFLNEFGLKMQKLLNNPAYFEAFAFIQDYNFGKMKHTAENNQKYQHYVQVQQQLEKSSL